MSMREYDEHMYVPLIDCYLTCQPFFVYPPAEDKSSCEVVCRLEDEFICREHDGHLCNLIEEHGFDVHRLC